jgi:hypothetical protein
MCLVLRGERTGEFRDSKSYSEKRSEYQIVDVTNKGMVNHYLRVLTMFYTSWCTTGLHLGHTCSSSYLNSQISEDTCEDACAAKKHNDFERQVSFSGLLQDTVRTHFVRPLGRSTVYLPPNITNCSDDPRRNIFSVDHRREIPR